MSSSLLRFADAHRIAARDVSITGEEEVIVRRLDSVDLPQFSRGYLKIDVQGTELDVLHGAVRRLRDVVAIELEVSLVPLYESQPLLHDVHAFLRERAFALVDLAPAFADQATGELLQFDAIFVRDPTNQPAA